VSQRSSRTINPTIWLFCACSEPLLQFTDLLWRYYAQNSECLAISCLVFSRPAFCVSCYFMSGNFSPAFSYPAISCPSFSAPHTDLDGGRTDKIARCNSEIPCAIATRQLPYVTHKKSESESRGEEMGLLACKECGIFPSPFSVCMFGCFMQIYFLNAARS